MAGIAPQAGGNGSGDALPDALEVVVADDSSLIRRRLIAMLERIEGIRVVGEAATAAKALQLVSSLKPDVLVLDIMMPGASGVEALESLKDMESPPYRIVLTNFPYEPFRKRCMRLGASQFLNKAEDFERLPGLLDELAKEKLNRDG